MEECGALLSSIIKRHCYRFQGIVTCTNCSCSIQLLLIVCSILGSEQDAGFYTILNVTEMSTVNTPYTC